MAETWKELFDDDSEANRYLVKAEMFHNYTYGWLQQAKSWKKLYDNEKEVLRCLHAAESMAKRTPDWKELAEGFAELLGDIGKAAYCETKANRKD